MTHKFIAIPARFYTPDLSRLREDLTEAEQLELATNYGLQPLTPDELAEIAQAEADELAQRPSRLNNYLDDVRWQKEVGGINVGGIDILTRDRDKTLVTGKLVEVLLRNAPDEETFNFTLNGEEVDMSVGQLKTVGIEMTRHVQNCIDAAAVVRPAIADGTLSDEESVKEAFDIAYGTLAGGEA